MANGSYIGKISALVTASTADLSRKLQGSTREVGRFANSVRSTIASASRSAERSLGGIFTPLQRIERALQFGRNARLNLGLTDQDVRRIQQAVSVSEGLNRPLASASRSFQRLSSDVGAAFLPSLIRAQEATERVNAEIATTGGVTTASFNAATRSVEQTTEAIRRLAEAESIIGRGPQGSALQFAQPQLFSALQSSAAARSRAAQPGIAERVGSDLGRAAQEVTRLDGLLAAAAARIESLRITPQVDTSALERAQGEYQDLLALQRGAVGELNRLSGSDSDAEFDAFVKSQQEQLRLERSLGDAAQQRAAEEDKVFQSYVRQQQQAKRLEQTLADLDPVERVRSREQAEAAATRRRDEELRVIEGRRTDLGGRLAEQGRRRVRGLTGDINIDSTPRGPDGFSAQAQRDIDALATRVGAVREQLETLPNSVRTRFIPELQRAQAQLVRLQNSPVATARAIQRASDRVEQLEASAKRAREALSIPSSQDFLGNINTRRAQGELEALRGVLAQVGAQAGDQTSRAYDRLAEATRRAIERGTLGLPRVQEQLKLLQSEAAKAAAQTGKISVGRAIQQIQRGGDIASKSFQNVGLAANQLAFVIDDFFSVTGGAEQRIRAVGNNITQLGFILGQTKGLFIALGAVLTAQAAVALVRYANGGAAAEDQTKALNDALARQKSLVEELRRAFESLGDAIGRRAFSGPAQEARDFARELDEIARKQRTVRESRVADLDEDVQRERGIQNSLTRRLENETSAGRRVALQRQLLDSREREQAAARAAASRRPTGDDVAAAVFEAELSRTAFRSLPDERRAARVAAGVDRGADANAIAAQRAEINRQIEQLLVSQNLGIGLNVPGGRQDAVDSLAELQRLLDALELPFIAALDDLANKISRASNAASLGIESAQEDVAEAILRGVRGAAAFQAALDESARQLAQANKDLEEASAIQNPEERAVAVRRAEGRVRDVRLRQEAISERAREVRLGRTFGGERTTAALSALEGNERFANEQARLTARVAAAVDAELQARRNLESAIASGDQAAQKLAREELEAAQAASDLAAAAAEAALSLEQAFARIRRTADNFLSASEGLADDAQRRLDELDPNAPGAPSRDELRSERDDAERRLVEDRARAQRLQALIDDQRRRAGGFFPVRRIDQRLEQLRSQREAAAERARVDGVQEDPFAVQARAEEEARLIAQRDEIIRQSTAGLQGLIDEENRLIAARRRAIEEIQRQREFEAELARRRDPAGDAIRGLDLLDSPGERAATQLRQSLADIDAAFDRQQEAILARAGGRPQDAQGELDELVRRQREAAARAQQDALRGVAPAIFGLADQVANAVLLGPSRAALTASDVSTVQGASELNRLLRGDDPSRNQDLVQLQRQSVELQRELVRLARDGGPQVANN